MKRWETRDGGQERANYAMFLTELCDLLELPYPDVASHATEANDYVFERVVKEIGRGPLISHRRIDLYKHDCFVLEAKQSRFEGEKRLSEDTPALPGLEVTQRGGRAVARGWKAEQLEVDLGIPSEVPGKAAKAAFPSADDCRLARCVRQSGAAHPRATMT